MNKLPPFHPGDHVRTGEYLHFVTGPRFGRRTTNVVK